MTNRVNLSDCKIEPEAEEFVERFARCIHDGTRAVNSGKTLVLLEKGVSNAEVQTMLEETGSEIPEARFEFSDRVVAVDQTDPATARYRVIEDHPVVVRTATSVPIRMPQKEPIDTEKICHSMIEDRPMEFVGAGAGRVTYSSVPDPEYHGAEEPRLTEFAECVIKFARGSTGFAGGREQNEDEVTQYQDLPADLKGDVGGRGPIFNPLRDWDDEDYLWVTQPYCPAPGDPDDVLRRANDMGWDISDIRGRPYNVGQYPYRKTHAVIDYGLSVDRLSPAIDNEIDQTIRALQSLGVSDGTQTVGRDGGKLEFRANALPGDVPPDRDSVVRYTRKGLVGYIRINLPGWDREVMSRQELRNQLRHHADDPLGMGVRYDIGADTTTDGYVFGTITVQIPRGDPLPVDLAIDNIEGIWENYEDGFGTLASGSDSTGTGAPGSPLPFDEITEAAGFVKPQAEWKDELEALGMRDVSFPGMGQHDATPDIEFRGPADAKPDPSGNFSSLYWFNAASVESINYRIAQFSATPDTRADARQQVLQIAREADDLLDWATVRADIPHVRAGRDSDKQVYDVRYEIDHRVDYMLPRQVIGSLRSITRIHNNTFAPSEVTRV